VKRRFVVSLRTSPLVNNRGIRVEINLGIVEIRDIVKSRESEARRNQGKPAGAGEKKPGSQKPDGNVETVTVPNKPESFLGRGDGLKKSHIDQLLAPCS
jgi:hypothetical protein